jgi:D-glycero-D-manno-heptose 1,7-bisphosphate phosphatase
MIRCVFFDRDGVVNRAPPEGGYVERWADFHLLPEFVETLRLVRKLGYAAVIVTNQRGVALGLMGRDAVEDIHRRLRAQLRDEAGLELLDILYCPHGAGECECRKPKPGMLLEAARRHGIDLAASWMVGDSERDVEAGAAAGCRTILVAPPGASSRADARFPDLAALRSGIAKRLAPSYKERAKGTPRPGDGGKEGRR